MNMSQILRDQATLLRNSSPSEIAVGHLKEAGVAEPEARIMVAQHLMEKEASEFLVTSAGIDIDQAVALVKAANVNVADLANFDFSESEENLQADILEKAAAYIDALEQDLSAVGNEVKALEKSAKEVAIEQIKLPESLEKLAGSGVFTNEDLAQLKSFDQELLTKVASNISNQPWEMGSGHGFAHTQTDPLLEFILN